METMPYHLSEMPSILELKDKYIQSFEELINFPIMSLETEDGLRLINYTIGSTETSKMFQRNDLRVIDDSLSNLSSASATEKYSNFKLDFIHLLETIKQRHDSGNLIYLMDQIFWESLKSKF